MFGLSLAHIILFGVILLIFVGPEQLPEVARTIARVLNELKRATSDFQNQFTGHIDPRRPWETKAPEPVLPPTHAVNAAPDVAPTVADPPPPDVHTAEEDPYAHHADDPYLHGDIAATSGDAPVLPEGAAPVATPEVKKS